MNCPRCGTAHPEPANQCRRCASVLPRPRCKQCKASIEWGHSYCERHNPENEEEAYCPACGVENDPDADYCKECGSPMAVITRVVATSEGEDHPDPWRVYGVETNFIGRDDELEALREILDETEEAASSRVALVSARPGLGKSRLFAEFEQRLEHSFSPTVVLRGVCREDVGGAFTVVSRMLRSRLYIPDSDNSAMARRHLVEAVEALVGDKADHISRRLGELIGLPFPSELRETTDDASPEEMERSSFHAVETLLRADATKNPLLFIVDDVHLAPDATKRLLRHLIDELEDAPILFALGQTDDTDAGLNPEEADLHLQLAPLSDAEVRHQVKDVLRLASGVPDNLVENIVDAALGNPLAVEEMLRIFMAEGIVDTRIEPWSIDAERVDDIELPTTVEETVAARLEGLTDSERAILEMAACVGPLFWDDLVRCLDRLRRNADERPETTLGDDAQTRADRRVDNALESLERKDIIRRQSESRLSNNQQFYFKHRLERKALYDQLPARLRKRNHRLIAQWMERRFDSNSDGTSEVIANHYARARCLRRAAVKFLDAGDDAARQHANQKAIELYLEGLGCLSDADMDLKMRAFHDVGSLFELRGDPRQALTYYRDMARYAWLLSDPSKAGAALNKIGRARRNLGHYDESLADFERALKFFQDADDEPGVASTLDDIGKIHWIRGHQDEALEYYRAALEMRRSLGDKRSIALSLSHVGSVKLSLGRLPDAMVYYREALQIRKEIDDRHGIASSYNDLGALCVERGQCEKAVPLFERAMEIAADIGYRGLECAAHNNLGEALIALKRRDEAQQHLQRAVELAEDIGQQRVLFDALRNLARLAVRQAERDLALERIDAALEIAHQLDSESYVAIAELTRAEIHFEYIFDPTLSDDSKKSAADAFRRAIELLDKTDVDIQLGNALTSFGHFLLECGETDEAREHLQRAIVIFEELDLPNQRAESEEILERVKA